VERWDIRSLRISRGDDVSDERINDGSEFRKIKVTPFHSELAVENSPPLTCSSVPSDNSKDLLCFPCYQTGNSIS